MIEPTAENATRVPVGDQSADTMGDDAYQSMFVTWNPTVDPRC